jgi:phosphoribosylformylglycinamidine synthase II
VLASAELEESDHAKRPSVQIGDPLEENKLIACCLDLAGAELLVALQDLGAGGLSSSASEMASKGGVGIDLDVSQVPLREADMEPFEIMISESQERMLCVVQPARIDAVLEVCARREVSAATIGEVTGTSRLRVFDAGDLAGDMPVSALVDECPLYDLEPEPPEDPLAVFAAPRSALAADASLMDAFEALLGSPNVASRRWAFEQYDFIVGSRTVRRPEQADAAVLKAAYEQTATHEEGRAIGISIDGNGRRVACDPYVGAAEAVCECAANLACVGAEPLGLTNCLNFGNPEKPHIAWQLTRAVEGLGAACRALGVPVVGGNVSLYNESPDGPIYPTPVVGMVGEIPDVARVAGSAFPPQDSGEPDMVALVGPFTPSLRGSELAKQIGGLEAGLEPFDLGAVRLALDLVREAVRAGDVRSAHDVSDGGLACCVAECAVWGGVGVSLDLEPLSHRAKVDPRTAMFGEGPGGILVSGPRERLMKLSQKTASVGFLALGSLGGDQVRLACSDATIETSVEDARRVFETGLADRCRE